MPGKMPEVSCIPMTCRGQGGTLSEAHSADRRLSLKFTCPGRSVLSGPRPLLSVWEPPHVCALASTVGSTQRLPGRSSLASRSSLCALTGQKPEKVKSHASSLAPRSISEAPAPTVVPGLDDASVLAALPFPAHSPTPYCVPQMGTSSHPGLRACIRKAQ